MPNLLRDLVVQQVVLGWRRLTEQLQEGGVAGYVIAVAAEDRVGDRRVREHVLEQRERIGDRTEPSAKASVIAMRSGTTHGGVVLARRGSQAVQRR